MIFAQSNINNAITTSIINVFPINTLINHQSPFQSIFGLNARQDATQIIIKKNDLIGLSPATSNTAESLLAGILVNSLRIGVSNEKININLWGKYIANNKSNHQIIIDLLNLLNITDYEYTNYLESINPMDY